MSRKEKYPGLYAGCKAAGVPYVTIYLRVKSGMSVEDALAMPIGKQGRKRGIEPVALAPRKPSRVYRGRVATEFPVPPAVKRWREQLVEDFMKRGSIDNGIVEKLRIWAKDQRHAKASGNDRATDTPTRQERSAERAGGGRSAFAEVGHPPQGDRDADEERRGTHEDGSGWPSDRSSVEALRSPGA